MIYRQSVVPTNKVCEKCSVKKNIVTIIVILLNPIYLRPSSVCSTTTLPGRTPSAYPVCITSSPTRPCTACPTSAWLRPSPSYLAFRAWLCPAPPLSLNSSLPRTCTVCPTSTWHWPLPQCPTCSERPFQPSSAHESPWLPPPLTSCWPCLTSTWL